MRNSNLTAIVVIFAITVGIWMTFVNARTVSIKQVASGDKRSLVEIYVSIGLGTILMIGANALSITALAPA